MIEVIDIQKKSQFTNWGFFLTKKIIILKLALEKFL